MRRNPLGVFVVLLFFAFVPLLKGEEVRKGGIEGSLVWDARTRTYLVYIPAQYDAEKPTALVIVLHGGGANAKNAQRMTGFSDYADLKGFIVVYPNGTGSLPDRRLTWNAGNCCGYALRNNMDDVGFIRALVDKLQEEYTIDPDRIYATGISNGGMMVYRLACELSDKIAAIAPVAGAMNVPTCLAMRPVSVIAFHGTEDKYVLYNGGWPLKYHDRHERKDASVASAMDYWVMRDACAPRPQEMERGLARFKTWSPCVEGTEVALVTITGGGHAWPGSTATNLWTDKSLGGISATREMWGFFERHPKKIK